MENQNIIEPNKLKKILFWSVSFFLILFLIASSFVEEIGYREIFGGIALFLFAVVLFFLYRHFNKLPD